MKLRDFQNKATEHLMQNQSVLIHAPTGLGKTWATANGFVQSIGNNALLGTRLLHVLPMRALANSVSKDIRSLLEHFNQQDISPTIHHGQQPESEIFAERVGVTTIDQYLAGFAGSPLSFASKSGHAVAGAIVASYSVFDEVHLLGPEKGLPLLYAILQQRQRWGLLSAVMTATLPSSVRTFLHEQVGLEIVEVSKQDVEQRDGWRNVTLKLEPKDLEASSVALSILEEQKTHGRVIAFVNTVDAAIELYRELEHRSPTCKLRLIHSNFAPSHRKEREEELLELFGKDSREEAIVVTTQVAEAGINISAPVVFSELAPIDSLIQRAGRCARFQENPDGTFMVYKPKRDKSFVPYNEDLIKLTEAAFELRRGEFRLDWQEETHLVDEVLDDFYAHFIRNENVKKDDAKVTRKKGQVQMPDIPPPKTKAITTGDALGILDQTFHSRDPSTLENTLREINNVQLVVVNERPQNDAGAMFVGDPDAFGRSSFQKFLDSQNRLWPSQRDTVESIPVSFGRFKRSLEERELWEVQMTRVEHSAPTVQLTKNEGRVLPNHTYVILQQDAGYSPDLGLTFQPNDFETNTPTVTPIISRGEKEDKNYEHHFQTWLEHCEKVYAQASLMLDKHYSMWICRLADKMQERDVIEDAQGFSLKVESLIRVAALFHDLGKLNKPWQDTIGWTNGEFWGKSHDNGVKKLPPHAFYALPALRYLFAKLGVVNDQGEVDRLAELIALASARHHSLGTLDGTMGWYPFELHTGVVEEVHKLLDATLKDEADVLKLYITDELFTHLNNSEVYRENEGRLTYTLDTPSPSEDYYPFYVLASRIIKVGDWEASGQREVELCR